MSLLQFLDVRSFFQHIHRFLSAEHLYFLWVPLVVLDGFSNPRIVKWVHGF